MNLVPWKRRSTVALLEVSEEHRPPLAPRVWLRPFGHGPGLLKEPAEPLEDWPYG
jgi:hypothetical protein